jgi:hypothetical protein
MELNDLLKRENIDPSTVLVFRHSPKEEALFKVMPWFITEKPQVFNAYQQTQTPRVEKQLSRARYAAAFFGHESDKAAFVGLYEKKGESLISADQLRRKPEHRELLKYAHDDSGPERLWFDLVPTNIYAQWKGRLIIQWPRPALVWSRWADKNQFLVDAILHESVFSGALPHWREMVFSWSDLHEIPQRWIDVLSRWRGVYYIWDSRDRRGYVGSATGEQGLYQRWIDYAKSGHGGNKLLKLRKPKTFQFSILEWAAPDMEDGEIRERERMWKERLHTKSPDGLNDN